MSGRIRTWLALTLTLAACAQQPWTKDGASDEERAKDQQFCEDRAYREVMKRLYAMSPVAPALASDSTARRFNVYPSGPFADVYGTQRQEEGRLTADCMREKGYQRKATP